jgi:signal transduction histidine kinase
LFFRKTLDILGKSKEKTEPAHPSEPETVPAAGVRPIEQKQHDLTGSGMRRDKIKIDLLIHDLKVPLAVIEAGIVSMLDRPDKYGPLTEKQERVLSRALRNTKITQRLVNDALELGRSGKGIINLDYCKVSQMVEQALVEIFDLAHWRTAERIKSCEDLHTLQQILDKEGIALHVDDALWCQELCLDLAKMSQILRNLLNNALKYRKQLVELGVRVEGQDLLLSVRDDGEGIPSMYHDKIFECYFQMNDSASCTVRGHGLGLAGVMVLVEDMGGKLMLESDQGKGAKFLVRLPLPDQAKGS